MPDRLPRSEYPKCPRCGGPVAGAMMTSQSVDMSFGTARRMTYYHPDAITVYCVSATCNYDHKLAELTTPVPEHEEVARPAKDGVPGWAVFHDYGCGALQSYQREKCNCSMAKDGEA